ncbi:MAG: TrpB-like pyridoxal phosphate-dependent enzyme [Deltaproteobacteria bacterium]|nr:TrpB-like pyridoxal phosphate-dependent enzyme [Deltaproteobacteria bacterium]
MHAITPSFTPSGVPTSYYNLFAAAKLEQAPPLDPQSGQPMAPDKLAALFPMALLEQEMTSEVHVPVPGPVLEAYAAFRPTPLRRAALFEKALGTRCTILYKYEGASPVGSHKLNTALAQAFANQQQGVRRIATETGAGQWGTALAYACRRFEIDCSVYMVRVSFDQKPARRTMMELYGATVRASPSEATTFGRAVLADNPSHPGSLGIAISEAIEDAVTHPGTKYSLGSVLNHVLLHQTVIGQEALRQLDELGLFPDVVIGCHGGGSNFAGVAFPFVHHKLDGKALRIIAAEPQSCPTLTRGEYRYDHGDTAKLTPLLKMYTLGSDFVPDPIHAGGLRYHGAAPQVSALVNRGLVEAQAFEQMETFRAAHTFAISEGVIPAPESAHAIAATVRAAREADQAGEPRVILFNMSGHGLLELGAYQAYMQARQAESKPAP